MLKSFGELPQFAQGAGQMASQFSHPQYSRRTFLMQGAATGVTMLGASTLGRRASAQSGSMDPIRLGLIGLGWRGGQHLDALLPMRECEVVALCDPESLFLDAASKKAPRAKTYADMRRLLDDTSIDAVVISTCNHWHCLAAVWACAAGKDVYVEKPLSYTLWEGQQLVNAARKHDRIVQVGTQQRSDPMQDEIRAFLHEDKGLGAIESVVVTRFGIREGIGKRSTPLEPPKTLDYDLWLGPAADRPIYRNKLDYDWHWDWNTGNGETANWGVHILDDVRNVVFNDRKKLPTEVACGGGRVIWDDAGDTPNLQFAALQAGGIPVLFALSNLPGVPGGKQPLRFENVESGYIVNCAGGSYHGYRGGGVALDPAGKTVRAFQGDSGAGHYRNFFKAVRSHDPQQLNADVAVGHDSTNWSHVINAAWRSASENGFVPAAAAADSPPLAAIEQLMDKHVSDYFPGGANGELKLSPRLAIDIERERFVGDGADSANVYLGPREFRAPFELKPVTV
jgi:predicted dehydrogenase